MIVAVEGPSAAGKTTWCSAHTGRFVPEYAPTGAEPDGSDPDARADYWGRVNSGRWAEALELERSTGVAVCDSDPLKLHYSWCLAVVGAAPWDRFERELQRCRLAFATGNLGLADLVVVGGQHGAGGAGASPKAADLSRRRRSFDLHVRLREPLLAWYGALERSSPGRVLWALPDDAAALKTAGARADRTEPALLDALVDQLPTVHRDDAQPPAEAVIASAAPSRQTRPVRDPARGRHTARFPERDQDWLRPHLHRC